MERLETASNNKPLVHSRQEGSCDRPGSNKVRRSGAPAIAVQAILKRSAERNLATSRRNKTPASSRSKRSMSWGTT